MSPSQKPLPEIIIFRCRKCLTDVEFPVPEELRKSTVFPVSLTKTHGDPLHSLVIKLNKHGEVESFEVTEIQKQEIMQSMMDTTRTKSIREVLTNIGLDSLESEIYLQSIGRGPMTQGEIGLLGKKTIDQIAPTIAKFIEKGLVKEIPGATKYYQSLPPYVALIAQLEQFSNLITQMRVSTPTDLEVSFSSLHEKTQSVQYIKTILNQLNSIRSSLGANLDKQKENLDANLQNLRGQGDTIKKIEALRDQGGQLLSTHFKTLVKEINQLKKRINTNLEKLHLGVVANTITQVIEKSIDMQIEQLEKEFQRNIESRQNALMNDLIKEVQKLIQSGTTLESDIRQSFSGLLDQFDTTVVNTEKDLQNIAQSVEGSYGDLQHMFSEEVVLTLDDVLGKIISEIDRNAGTIREFWEESKRSINFTMKDVWFVRTPEGMKSQINDALSRAKMRILIIAPSLTDIDLEPLQTVPKHLNIRICCSINQKNPVHRQILDFLDKFTNISYRERPIQNLWAVNKDFEEIILGIVNQKEMEEVILREVAGIGSILSEHIKIFAPILEDAWVNARKSLSEGFDVKSPIKFIPKIEPMEPVRTTSTKDSSIPQKKSEIPPEQLVIPTPGLISPTISPTEQPALSPLEQSKKRMAESGLKFSTEEPTPVEKRKLESPKVLPLEDLAPKTAPTSSLVKPSERIAEIEQKNKTRSLKSSTKIGDMPQFVKSDSSLVRPSERIAQIEHKLDSSSEDTGTQTSELPLETQKLPSEPATFSVPVIDPFNPALRFKKTTTSKKGEEEGIMGTIQSLADSVITISPQEIEARLEKLMKELSFVEHQQKITPDIRNWISTVRSKPTMDEFNRKMLLKRIEFWKTSIISTEEK